MHSGVRINKTDKIKFTFKKSAHLSSERKSDRTVNYIIMHCKLNYMKLCLL